MFWRKKKPGESRPSSERSPGAPLPPARLGPRLAVRQRSFARGEDFIVRDDQGSGALHVDGSRVKRERRLYFRDVRGNILYHFSTFPLDPDASLTLIDATGGAAAEIQSMLEAPVHDFYRILLPEGVVWSTRGNIIYHEYVIERDGRPRARISKNWFHMHDTYGVEVSRTTAALTVAITVGIDFMACQQL